MCMKVDVESSCECCVWSVFCIFDQMSTVRKRFDGRLKNFHSNHNIRSFSQKKIPFRNAYVCANAQHDLYSQGECKITQLVNSITSTETRKYLNS